ncbi:sigma-54-dependent transcriptional regulator [Phocaeicola sp.]
MDSILIIDDEPQIRKLLSRMMELEGYEVFQAVDCQSTLKQLKQHHDLQVVLCDVFLPDGNGVDLVTTIKKLYPELEVILLTAHGNIPDGVQAIKNGAFDYITKGDDNNKIIPLISRAMEQAKKNIGEKVKSEEQLPQTYSFETIQGKSACMQQAVELARKVSATDVTVLLTGETGTGKEVFAQAIHRNSLRRDNTFVAVNCSAFSKDLLESEIFGHKAGSFTGAMKDKKGLFEVANNGTIFLDEIGEMAFELQAKLLRVLEAGEYIKIGDTKPTKVNVRIISATNRDLKKEIEQGNFREDLYYRLSVFQIHLPPLRERREDIEVLTDSFIRLFSKKLGKQIEGMTPEFFAALKVADWKGNIRELRNVIERSMIVCEKQLTLQDLPIEIQNTRHEDVSGGGNGYSEFELAAMEKRHIAKVLQYTKGNKTEASRLLKIGLTTLYRKIEEYGI